MSDNLPLEQELTEVREKLDVLEAPAMAYNRMLARAEEAESAVAALERELDSYKDGHLCHPALSMVSSGGGICAHCGRTLLTDAGYADALTKAERAANEREAEAARLREALVGIDSFRREQLYQTCPDCEDGCTHGASSDRILKMTKAALEQELADMSNGLIGQTAEKLRLQRELVDAQHDILVYRGALGYPMPGEADDRLTDGTHPVNSIAEAMGWHHEENQRFQGELVTARAEAERAARWGYLAGQDAEYDHSQGRPVEPFAAAWARYQQEREDMR